METKHVVHTQIMTPGVRTFFVYLFIADDGSVIKQDCTKFTNTKCECRKDFVPRDSDYSICQCAEGFKQTGGTRLDHNIGSFTIHTKEISFLSRYSFFPARRMSKM